MNTKAITRFVIYFSAIYGLELLSSPVGDKLYAEFFRSVGERAVTPLFPKGEIGFIAVKNAEMPKFSTTIRIANKKDYEAAMQKRQAYRSADISVSSWYSGYLPTMLTLALLLAIPGLAWRQRLIAIVAGLITIHLFILAKLYIQILYEFERNDWMQVTHFSPFWQQVMDKLYYLFAQSMGLNFAVPVLICIVTLACLKAQPP